MGDTLTTKEKLELLVEECAEVIQAATKCMRFGVNRTHEGYGNNLEVLSAECGDVLGMMDSLPLNETIQRQSRNTKIKRAEEAKRRFGVRSDA